MDYEYEEVDAHGALDALRDCVTVEYKYGQEWNTLTGDNSLWLMHDHNVKFRIRREKKRETVEEAIALEINNCVAWVENEREGLRRFAAALKAEILEEVKK